MKQSSMDRSLNYRTLLIAALPLVVVSSAQAETGLASYGGRGGMTCAHRTKPMGTVLTVSYGGRSI
jgi:rare lipoprotein A